MLQKMEISRRSLNEPLSSNVRLDRLSLQTSQVASGRSLSRFPKHEATKSISTPLAGVLVHRRVTPTEHYIRWYPFIHLGGERHCESKVSFPRTQHNVSGQGSNPDRSIRGRAH